MTERICDRIIIGCAYTVISSLGRGFLEKVYENALFHEVVKHDIQAIQQHPVKVTYDCIVVGEYISAVNSVNCWVEYK